MFQRKPGASSKPSISQFDISQVDNMISSTATNSNKNQGIRFEQVSQLLRSNAQQNNDIDIQQEPRLMHRESKTALDIFRKKVSSNAGGLVSKRDHDSDAKAKDPLYEALLKRVQGDETIINQLKHNIQQMDKRTSDRSRKIEKQFEAMKNQFSRSFQKMIQQIKCKFTNVDHIIQGLKSDFDNVKEGNFYTGSSLAMSISKPKQKQIQKQIIYDLDVKSSIDGLKAVLPSAVQSQQMSELMSQIQNLRQQISKQQTSKSKTTSQYEQLRNQLQSMSIIFNTRAQQKMSKIQTVLQEHDQNIQKINQQFQKAINDHINPRISLVQQSIQLVPQMVNKHDGIKKTIDELTLLKNDLQQNSKNSDVVRVKKANDKQKELFKKAESIDMQNTYYLDQCNYLLDSKGIHLLDESNNKIKVQEDNIYFLNLHGINIMNIQ